MYPAIAEVIVDRALGKPLDYGVTAEQLPHAVRGQLVTVTLRGHKCTGTILAVKEKSALKRLVPLHEILSDKEVLPDDLFELALWMSRYYCTELSKVLKILLPAAVRETHSPKTQLAIIAAKGKKHLREECRTLRQEHPAQGKVLDAVLLAKGPLLLSELLEKAKVSKSPVTTLIKKGLLTQKSITPERSSLIGESYFRTSKKRLSAEQSAALKTIVATVQEETFCTHLLWGITGSGKTEVYLQAIEETLSLDKGVLLLVPEITLTTQTIEKFRSRFSEPIAVLHHRLTPSERRESWDKIRRKEIRIVVGARSALFSPIPQLGLIVVDEEHDSAYKQSERAPLYHARDVAVMRGKISRCTVVLGTATPSLESYTNALEGKYRLLSLTHRVAEAKLPQVTLVDMKECYKKSKGFTSFSDTLIEGIKKRHESGEQVILFLNRRGTHTSLLCHACSHVFNCPHCDVALTFHKQQTHLLCHHCNYSLSPPPKYCPNCQSSETFKFRGVGTELVERSLNALLPEVRVLRIDGDTTRHVGSHERLFRAFATGKADVLVGTQMITKGLHFPSVTLVAILNTDSALHIPDFRASETTFSLITQVAGRSGRGQLKGEVFIQTLLPDNTTLLHAAKQDYKAFYDEEIVSRKCFNYPPFSHLVKFGFTSVEAELAQQVGERFRHNLKKHLPATFAIHPLNPAGIARVNDRYRFHFLVRGPGVYPISDGASQLIKQEPIPKKVSLSIDVDPLSTFF